jgi:hypothetical protein
MIGSRRQLLLTDSNITMGFNEPKGNDNDTYDHYHSLSPIEVPWKITGMDGLLHHPKRCIKDVTRFGIPLTFQPIYPILPHRFCTDIDPPLTF